MSFVNNSSSTGINFIGSTSEAGRIGKPGPVSAPVSTSTSVPSGDRVAQSAGAQGQAKPVNFLDASPQVLQFKQLLSAGKFDDLEKLIAGMALKDLKELHLSVQEIAKIADGMGKGDLMAALPLVGSYTDSEKAAVKRLINNSAHLSVNQRVFLLKDNIGPGAVLEFIQKASDNDLKQLSSDNRRMALSVLDPSSSIWGTIVGAGTELITRRANGEQRPEDRLAGQILRSAKTESELHELLAQINQFGRDDAAHFYVKSLSPKELNDLSDGMKKELLQNLVDTGIQLPFFNLDLNSIANLDETLKMTFKEHADAASLLYQALSPKAQQSKEVQTIVAKSDDLMKDLAQLQEAIEKDKRSETLTQAKLADYRKRAETLKLQTAGNPELQQKAQALLDTLTSLQKDLRSAAKTQVVVVQDFTQTRSSIEKAKTALAGSQQALETLKTSLPQAQTRLKEREEQMLKLYGDVLESRKKLGGMEPRYTQLLNEMEAALQNPKTQKGKLAQLESFNQQLKQLESQFTVQGQEALGIMAEVNSISETLESNKVAYNRAAEQLNQECSDLRTNQSKLNKSLATYEQKVANLETGLSQAKKQYQELSQSGAQPTLLADLQKEITAIEKEIGTHRTSLSGVQKDYTQYLVPEVEKIELAQTQQNTERQALEPLFQVAEAIVDATGGLFQPLYDTLDYLKQKVSDLVSQTKEFASNWASRLAAGGSISSADIQAFQDNFSGHMDALKTQLAEAQKENAPELRSQLEAQIAALKALETTINELKTNIDQTDTAVGSLEKSLTHLTQATKQTESEINATNDLIDISKDAIINLQGKIAEIELKVTELKGNMAVYGDNLSVLKDKLNQSQADAQALQQKFSQGQISGVELSRLLKENQKLQQELQGSLSLLYQDMGRVSSKLDNNLQALKGHEDSLNDEQKNLETARQTAEKLRDQLKIQYAKNQGFITSTKQELLAQKSLAEKYPAVQEKHDQINGLLDQLEAGNKSAEAAITRANDSVLAVVPLNRKVDLSLKSVADVSENFNQLKSNQLSHLQQSMDLVNRKFVGLKEQAQAITQEVAAFEHSLRSGELPFNIADTLAHIDKLIQSQAIPAAQVDKLLALKGVLESARKLRLSGDVVLAQHQHVRADNSANYTAAQEANNAVRAELSQLESGISEAEAELKTGQQDMLTTQKKLLEMRKTLGITSADYNARLERYEDLLKRGDSLTPQEITELQDLEQGLSQIEAAQSIGNDRLKEQLTSLNTLKAKINKQIDSLSAKSKHLLDLKKRLSVSLNLLVGSRNHLAQKQMEIQNKRAELADSLAQIEKMLKDFPGSQELLAIRQQIVMELTETDLLLGRYGAELLQTDKDISASTKLIQDIDITLLTTTTIQEKLAMLVFQLTDLIQQGEALLADFQQLEQELNQMKAEVSESKNLLSEGIQLSHLTQSQKPSETVVSPKDSSTIASVQKFFGTGFSGLMRQRQISETTYEKDRQAKREKFMKALEQQVAQSRQNEGVWKAKIQDQAQLEKITEHLIQSAYNGQMNVSGINIVGLNEKVALQRIEQA
jgi:chromosome segregation ATPase